MVRKRHDQNKANWFKMIEENWQAASLEEQALFQGGATSASVSKLQAGGKRPRDLEGEEGGGATSKQACTDTSRGGGLDVYENRRLYPANKKSVPPGWTSREKSGDTGAPTDDTSEEHVLSGSGVSSPAKETQVAGFVRDPLLEAAPAPEVRAEFDSTDARVKALQEHNARLQQEMDQKETENQELVMLVGCERAAAAAAKQERASAAAAAAAAEIRVKAVLAKATGIVKNLRKDIRCEVAKREAAEANAKRLQALLAQAEEVHLTPHTLHLTLHTPHPTPYTLNPKPYTLHPTPYTLHASPFIHSIPITLHPTPCTLHSTSLIIHPNPTPYTFHLAPYTLHPTTHTLHHAPCTLHPSPHPPPSTSYALYPEPYPSPYTRHPTPSTLHPTP